MAMYEYEKMDKIIEGLSSMQKASDAGMSAIYNRMKAIEQSLYVFFQESLEEQKRQTQLLEQIAMACPNKCEFPKGVGLSQEELEGTFK
ncbi:MAG: hypothetical protein J6K42_06090 [Clostridia bacterium]|nr:hypothetical protein [Clostridia bacterium]